MSGKINNIASNKKAWFDYEILDRYEAGVVLVGTEVKAIRQGMINLKDSFAKIIQNELWLVNTHISEYKFGNIHNHEPTRSRKLLLHRKELNKLFATIREKGLTLVPLKVYLKDGRVKIEIGLCKGKKLYDKRETARKKEQELEIKRLTKKY